MELAPKKSLGQHFLNNPHVPARMAEAAAVAAGDTVVEIGPGTGVLTKALLERGATVIALEADARAVELLGTTFKAEIANKKLVILHTDVRELDLGTLGLCEHSYKVVANIPYYLSGRLFRLFLESSIQPSELVFLVQKEVAERIARDPKESLLALSVKAFGDPEYVVTVKRGNFTPPPKVESAIIAVRNISHERLGNIPENIFFTIIHAGFASRRKQLLGNLLTLGTWDRPALESVFTEINIPLTIRGEDLPLGEWCALINALSVHTLPTPSSQS